MILKINALLMRRSASAVIYMAAELDISYKGQLFQALRLNMAYYRIKFFGGV